MTDPCEDICDDLVASLNEAQDPDESSEEENPFSITFKAENVEDPNGELDKTSDLIRVLVWPHASTATKIGRTGQCTETHSVAMLVIRKTQEGFRRAKIGGLERQIKLFVRSRRFAVSDDRPRGWVWSEEESSKFDLEHMHEYKRVELSTILTFIGTA